MDEAFAAIDKAKQNAEKNLQNARELFESYLQNIFTNPGVDWEVKALGDIATFPNGLNFNRNSRGETIKIVGVKDFQKSFWVPSESLESVRIEGKLNETDLLRENDLIAVRSNDGNQELIGRFLLAGKTKERTSHSGFTIRTRISNGNVDPQYLCHFLKTPIARKHFFSGGTGVNIKSLNQTTLSSLAVSLPSLSEQKAIVEKLVAIEAESTKVQTIYRNKIASIEDLKKSILQKAFNGSI